MSKAPRPRPSSPPLVPPLPFLWSSQLTCYALNTEPHHGSIGVEQLQTHSPRRTHHPSTSSYSPGPPTMEPATPEPHRSNTLPSTRPTRPRFNSMLTSDRLRESYLYRPSSRETEAPRRPRRSVFREIGLDDAASDTSSAMSTPTSSPDDVFTVPSGPAKVSPA